jgi:hypothetical protein
MRRIFLTVAMVTQAVGISKIGGGSGKGAAVKYH